MVSPLNHSWHGSLGDLVAEARSSLTIAAPFITNEGAKSVVARLHSDLRSVGRLNVITDLSPAHVQDGSMDPHAVRALLESVPDSGLWHVPRFHAKVYVADGVRAIVTSGNLTASAFYQNVEYGVDISDVDLVARIDEDMSETRYLGVFVNPSRLSEYARATSELRAAFERQRTAVDPAIQEAFSKAVRTAEDELVRFRLEGGAMHTVFAKTLVHLLRKHGPMRTQDLHGMIRRLHPELCDDQVDRVIDGKHYGKKWKHAVRSAQQHAKRQGLVVNEGDLWMPTLW